MAGAIVLIGCSSKEILGQCPAPGCEPVGATVGPVDSGDAGDGGDGAVSTGDGGDAADAGDGGKQ